MDISLFISCISVIFHVICRTVWGCSSYIPHGFVWVHCSTSCSYWCDEGYERAVDTLLDCDKSSYTWVPYDEHDKGISLDQLCRPKMCPNLTIPNGNLLDCVPTVGSTCLYLCKTGYKPHIGSISCQQSQQWSENPLLLCTRDSQCPHEIPRGSLNSSCGRNPGDVCSFSCDVMMMSEIPSKTLTCGNTSSWDIPLDSVCTKIQCPTEIPNGHIASSCARVFNDRCHFYCDDGFMKSPTITFLTCDGTAQWDWGLQESKTLCLDESKQCPAKIDNGKISSYCDRAIGSKCSYSCERGCSINNEVFELTCHSSLTWQPRTQLCWDCGFGTCNSKIPHGRIMNDNCQEHCLYYCDRGYEESTKLNSLKCSTNNTWVPKYENTAVPEDELCQAKSCPNITIPNGVIGNCPRKVDTSCSYSCNAGYHQKSPQVACLKSTEWEDNTHVLCTNDKQCPYEITNGALNSTCNRNPGETCTYTCDEGHLAVDTSRSITCGIDSLWDKSLRSVCPVIRCPDRIPHGTISRSCGRGYEDSCLNYECDEGYEKPTSHHLKCNDLAQWEIRWAWLQDSLVLCAPKLCPELYIPNGAHDEGSTCNMQVETTCSYSCNSGYNETTPHVSCLPTQTWYPSPHSLCTNKTQCPYEIPRGELNAKCGRNYGETCSYNCDEGTIAFNSSKKITCGTSAKWDIPLEAVCTVIKCPATIGKAVISLSACGRGYRDECLYYTCPPGYDKEPRPVWMGCNGSAMWEIRMNKQPYTGELCKARSCSTLYVPNGSHGDCLSKVDTVCNYTCYEGYRQKSPSVTCLPTQQWDLDLHSLCYNSDQCEPYDIPRGQLDSKCGRNPGDTCNFFCDGGMMPKEGRLYCTKSHPHWDKYLANLCTVFRCPDTIPGGHVPTACGRSYGDNCYTFLCDTGFEKVYYSSSNKPYLKCNASAQWEVNWTRAFSSAQLCLETSKLCPSTIKNGTIWKSCHRTIGTKCSYSCDRHCSSRSYGSLTCLDDKTWRYGEIACYNCVVPSTRETCPDTIENGRISATCGRHYNKYCNYYCDYGCRKTRSTLLCTSLGYWEYEYSACECGYRRTTASFNNADIYDSNEESGRSSSVTTILIIIGVLVFCVVVCVFVYAVRKQQQDSDMPLPEPSSNTPVVYHPVTTNTPVVTNGRRDSPPNYNSIGPRDQTNLEPLLPDTGPTASAPERPSEGLGDGMPSSPSGIDLDGYPPPPSYNEVVSDPEKYQTHTEHHELQAD